jgi:small-conductance mechanosensitive channel
LVLATAILLSLAARAADTPPSDDTTARVAQLRELLASDRGATILDLLGDPRVRQAVLQDAAPAAPGPSRGATAGQMMDTMLTGVRARLWGMGAGLGQIGDDLARVWVRTQLLLPGAELFRLVGFLIVFVAAGTGARLLFFRLARPWLAHFNTVSLATPRQRALAVGERLLFGALIIAAFATGSMGAFLLFSWPPLTGSIILGYLLAAVLVRLSLTSTRFFLAPTAEHLRLLPVSTETAWFWHHWVTRLIGTAAIGWQTILTLRSLGLSEPGGDVLRQLLLLLLTGLGIFIVWTMPACSNEPTHGRIRRLLLSLGLVLDWLLFLMGSSALGWSLLIVAAVPLAIYILSRSISLVMLGRWPEPDAESSAYVAIAERAMQALIVMLATVAMVHVWQIDMTRVSDMDTPMIRIVRGLLEALVILVIADLLWQVVRVLIDTRLAMGEALTDDLDDDAQRRRARLRTLLPVLRNFAFFIVLVMASLSALAAMGLQIGPLLAGAGVVGIAVGFGAQTLVRDIISGIFFLMDDAFRVGEQIESSGIHGKVESFSLRSIKLRHLNGQMHTVPFGDLKAITNYSRDWVVERLSIVVTYDTDLDLLDNVVDTVSDELMADQSMAAEMIEPLKSIGVQAMIDTGMQVGLVFKTRPGRQFAIRRVVFGQIRAAFAAHGIRFATAIPQPPGSADAPARV